jgi:23S rRNA (adenine2503-C2)-methyltransferase
MRERLEAPGLMPCISTIAPVGSDDFFQRLKELNHTHFKGNFQLQFSIHSTSEEQRDLIIPVEKWDLERISSFGNEFFIGGRKVSLNFALGPENELDVEKISQIFSPDVFMIKLTPVNPTSQSMKNAIVREDLSEGEVPQIKELEEKGFEVVLSVGDLRENEIGSNCGQLAALWKKE